MVYHLEVECYANRFGNLIENSSFHTGVFSTLEIARKEGEHWIKRRLNYIYGEIKQYGRRIKTLEEMLKDKTIYYRFEITELDPNYVDKFKGLVKENKTIDNCPPTYIVYNYDYKGTLKDMDKLWQEKGKKYALCINKREGDELPDAGTKFKVGDFVNVINDDEVSEKEIFVVYYTPKAKKIINMQNTYVLACIGDNTAEFIYEFHENDLKKHEGEVAENSPLNLLQKICKNEIEISKETMDKIEKGEILFNDFPSWRDIPELKI